MAKPSKILLRRGTLEAMQALPGGAFDDGEIIFTTDTKQVFVNTVVQGVHTQNLIGGVQVGTNAERLAGELPAGSLFFCDDTGKLWLKRVGATWEQVGSRDLDGVPDGSLYNKIKATETGTGDGAGKIVKLYAPTATAEGGAALTADELYHHVNELDETGAPLADTSVLHHVIDDSSYDAAKLWSGKKAKDYIDAAVEGFTWREPVDMMGTKAERLAFTGMADGMRWMTTDDDQAIYTYDLATTSWVVTAPVDNWAVLVKTDDSAWTYNADTQNGGVGAGWVQFSASAALTFGAGLIRLDNEVAVAVGPEFVISQTGQETYATLKLAQQAVLPAALDPTVAAVDGGLSVAGDGSGISISYDPNVLAMAGNSGSQVLTVSAIDGGTF
jgi:hypothetical protein